MVPTMVACGVFRACRRTPGGSASDGSAGCAPDADRAMPKSMMTACSPSIMMLAGLRSRCTTPASCAAANPAATCRMIASATGTGTLPSRFSTVARSSPLMYDIVMYLMPSISPRS